MSSSENEDVSHTIQANSPEQVDEQAAAVLHSLERVRKLIDAEVEIASHNYSHNNNTARRASVQRSNSLVRQKISYFESKSTGNLASNSACWISGLPLYQPKPLPGNITVSLPACPERL